MRAFYAFFAAITSVLAYVGEATVAAVDYVLALFPPGPELALAAGGFPVERSQSGIMLPRSLQNDMRHESRTSRIGAPRHT